MKIKPRIPDLIILFTVASVTLCIISRNLPFGMGSFAFLWAPISFLVIMYLRPATFTKEPIRILFLYGIIMVGILQYTLWTFMNDWNRIRIIYEFYYLVVIIAIYFYYCGKGNFKMFALLSRWTFIFIIITLITTNIALFLDPTVVRESARTGEFTPLQERIYRLSGAMGYSYIQSVVCLIPILVYHIKSKRNMVFSPKVLTAILILIIITQIRSQVFGNIIVTLLITILSIMGSRRRFASFISISVIIILFVAIPKSFYTDVLNSLSSNFNPDSELYYKLTDFAKFIENPEFDTSTGTGGRAARYPLLYKALAAKPFLGDAAYNSGLNISGGAHLYWMNRLTLWGIPGFLFFVYVLFKIYKSISSQFNPGYRFFYFLSVMSIIFLGLLKAIGGSENWLMLIVVIPGLYYLPLLEQTSKSGFIQIGMLKEIK